MSQRSKSVLFVCYGNVCRSPYAAVAMKRRLGSNGAGGTAVTSAGFIGPNRSPPETAIQAARARELDMTSHRSQVANYEIAGAADIIFVMNSKQRRAIVNLLPPGATAQVFILGDLDPEPIDAREIYDPWGADRDVFDQVYDRVDRCIEVLVNLLSPSSP